VIGIDTNILLRYLAQDDPVQSEKATRFLNSLTPESPGFISLITLSEFYWVLDHSFKLSRSEIQKILEELVATQSLIFEQPKIVEEALAGYASGQADFDDYLIVICAQRAGCEYIVTFDRDATRDGLMQQLI
jgi:predicted nucleic-acid-binding protein